MIHITKTAESVSDLGLNWIRWLPKNDNILTSSWTIEDDNDTLILSDQQIINGKMTSCMFSGGSLGVVYKVFNHIVTFDGREESRYFYVKIEEKSIAD